MTERRARDAHVFLALACAITWTLDLPMALAIRGGVAPPPWSVPLVALGAFGPTLAALAVAAARRDVRGAFGRLRARPWAVLAALLVLPALQLVATVLGVAIGGHPGQWFHPPAAPEHVAAMVVFPVGEELGWRGFAYPRLVARHGPVLGSAILGAVWGLWHFMMWFSPAGAPAVSTVVLGAVWLVLASIVMAWAFERSGRALLVAIALHAGAHLDNVFRAEGDDLRIRVLRYVVLGAAALLSARALSAPRVRASRGTPPDPRFALETAPDSRAGHPRT